MSLTFIAPNFAAQREHLIERVPAYPRHFRELMGADFIFTGIVGGVRGTHAKDGSEATEVEFREVVLLKRSASTSSVEGGSSLSLVFPAAEAASLGRGDSVLWFVDAAQQSSSDGLNRTRGGENGRFRFDPNTHHAKNEFGNAGLWLKEPWEIAPKDRVRAKLTLMATSFGLNARSASDYADRVIKLNDRSNPAGPLTIDFIKALVLSAQ
jgi:hypothetical protein